MTSLYAATAQRALATIARKGAPVSFPYGAPPEYDGATDTWSADTRTTAIGKAVQDVGDPDRLRALSLIGVDTVTLLVAAVGFVDSAGTPLAFTPALNTPMTWAGKVYTVKSREDTAPDGQAIVWSIVGSR